MKTIHAMIDLETLATTDDAVITQIGLVFFDINGPRQGESHEWIVNAQTQTHRTIDSDTMQWHLRAGERAEQLARSYSSEALPLGLALEYVTEEIQRANPGYIWAKSPTFDLRILAHAMRGPEKYMPVMEQPWKFHQ
ncbi:MAG: 3'-5' exoribonuclease, partial [Halomonas sp.]|nr:3'-5' exoribonuclease [Halomonas sp.]